MVIFWPESLPSLLQSESLNVRQTEQPRYQIFLNERRQVEILPVRWDCPESDTAFTVRVHMQVCQRHIETYGQALGPHPIFENRRVSVRYLADWPYPPCLIIEFDFDLVLVG